MNPLARSAAAILEANPGFDQKQVISADEFVKRALGTDSATFSARVHYIVPADLRLQGKEIKSMPVNLTVNGRFDIRGCNIQKIHGNFNVDETFFIGECSDLTCISGRIQTGKAFSVRGLTNLNVISAVLKIGKQMDAAACKKLVDLSDSDIAVGFYLSLANCEVLEKLPTKPILLREKGYINLRGCPNINDATACEIHRDSMVYSIARARAERVIVQGW